MAFEDRPAYWAFGIRGAIEKVVRENFPGDLRQWPLLREFDANAFRIDDKHFAIILRDKLSGVPVIPSGFAPFPHVEHPGLPVTIQNIDAWLHFLHEEFRLRDEDVAMVLPAHDSGKEDAAADFRLFSAAERALWEHQLRHAVARQHTAVEKAAHRATRAPSHVTFSVSGPNSRVNFNSVDNSTNVVNEGGFQSPDLPREANHEVAKREPTPSVTAPHSPWDALNHLWPKAPRLQKTAAVVVLTSVIAFALWATLPDSTKESLLLQSASAELDRPTFYEQNSAVEKLGVAGQEFQARLNWLNRGKNPAEDILVLVAWWEAMTLNPRHDSGILVSTAVVPGAETFHSDFPIPIYKNAPSKFIFVRLKFRDQVTGQYYAQDFWLKTLGVDADGNFQANIVSVSAAEKAEMMKRVAETSLLSDPRLLEHGSAK